MKMVVLAGGKGTRIKEVTDCKMLLPFEDVPLITRVVDYYLYHCPYVDWEFVFVINGRDMPLKWILSSTYGESATFLIETERLGTGGWLKKIGPVESPFLMICGDVFLDLDVTEVMHLRRDEIATTILTPVPDLSEYGRVRLDDDTGRITNYLNRDGEDKAGLAVSGAYVFSPQIFEYLPKENAFSLETVLRKIASVGMNGSYIHKGFWLDVGTKERLTLAYEMTRCDERFRSLFLHRKTNEFCSI